jgi:hypothetical protein
MPTALRDVRSEGQSGKHLLALSFPVLTQAGPISDIDQLARFPTESSFCSFRHIAGARASFDHLVGQREQRGRHGEAKRFRGLTINDEFELCRQVDG